MSPIEVRGRAHSLYPWTVTIKKPDRPETSGMKAASRFGSDHVYSLTEIHEVAQASSQLAFFVLERTPSNCNAATTEAGFDDKQIADEGRRILENQKKMFHFDYQEVFPVLLKSEYSRWTWLVFLASAQLEQIKGAEQSFSAEYYATAEAGLPGRRLLNSLPRWAQTEEYQQLKDQKFIDVLVLGNACSGNYTALRTQMSADRIKGAVTIIDLNSTPLDTLVKKGLLQVQDRVVRADITQMPFAPEVKFDVMFGDYILSCFHPAKIHGFFHSLAKRLAPRGKIFLTLCCNNIFETKGMEEINFAFYPMFSRLGNYFKGTYSLYEELARRNGLSFKVIHRQLKPDSSEERDYWLVLKHLGRLDGPGLEGKPIKNNKDVKS